MYHVLHLLMRFSSQHLDAVLWLLSHPSEGASLVLLLSGPQSLLPSGCHALRPLTHIVALVYMGTNRIGQSLTE